MIIFVYDATLLIDLELTTLCYLIHMYHFQPGFHLLILIIWQEYVEIFGYSHGQKERLLDLVSKEVEAHKDSVRQWVRDVNATKEIICSERGKHSKTISPIQDPIFREELRDFVRSNSCKPGDFRGKKGNRNYWRGPKLQWN